MLREELPATTSYYILHEGLIGVFDQGYEPLTYKKAMELNGVPMSFTSKMGWLGIADKYWATVLVPPQGQEFKAQFNGAAVGDEGHFRADFVMTPRDLAPGATTETKNLMFAGAKEVNLVDKFVDHVHPGERVEAGFLQGTVQREVRKCRPSGTARRTSSNTTSAIATGVLPFAFEPLAIYESFLLWWP